MGLLISYYCFLGCVCIRGREAQTDVSRGCDPKAGEDNEGDEMQERRACACRQLFASSVVTRRAQLSSRNELGRVQMGDLHIRSERDEA